MQTGKRGRTKEFGPETTANPTGTLRTGGLKIVSKRPVAHLTARGLSAEEVSQAYSIVAEMETQAGPHLRELARSVQSALPEETWTQVVRLVEAYRDLMVQSSMVALAQGLRHGATDFFDRLGPPRPDVSPEIPSEEEMKQALAEGRLSNRIVNLGSHFGLDPVEVVYAQAVGSAIEARYQARDESMLWDLVEAGEGARAGQAEQMDMERAFTQLADQSHRKWAEMLVAAYVVGRLKGERSEWERIRQRVLEIW